MKLFKICFILSVILSNILFSQNIIDRIIAVVDKEIITESELKERVNFLAAQNKIDIKQPNIYEQILESMISEKLILAQAIIDSVVVSDEDVSRTLDQQLANLINQYGSELRIEQMYGKSITRIKREYRDEIKNQLLIQKIRQQKEMNVTISKRETEEFYYTYKDSLPDVPEEYSLSHIYINPKPDTYIENKTKLFLQAIRDSIINGGDFADFAKRYSDDPGSATSGGNLGWTKRGTLVKEFEEEAFSLKENEISPIVKTQFGFHIIQLLERKGEAINTRHILITIEKGPTSDSITTNLLLSIKNRILNGESFAVMAKKYSEDENTKSIGGTIGDFTLDNLTPDLIANIKDLKPGEISDPKKIVFGNSYGFHIVWLRNKIPAHKITLENDFNRIQQIALFNKKNKLNQEWINQLKKTIYVDVRL